MSNAGYKNRPTAEGIRFYHGLEADPVSAITNTLIHNLGTRNFELAKKDYSWLVKSIRNKGNPGKDVRYAKKELHDLSKQARLKGSTELANLAAFYANQLPSSNGDLRRVERKLKDYSLEIKDETADMPSDEVAEKVIKIIREGYEGHISSDDPIIIALIEKLQEQGDYTDWIPAENLVAGYQLMVKRGAGHNPKKLAQAFIDADANPLKLEEILGKSSN